MKRILLVTLTFLFLTACTTPAEEAAAPEFDIRGEWTYTMTASDGNTYDEGTITFSGQPQAGTYQQVNFYQITYEGTYTVNGNSLQLSGHETWQGTISDANTIRGPWERDGASGFFTANR